MTVKLFTLVITQQQVQAANLVMAVYRHDADYIEGFIPLPYTPYPLYPVNALDMISNCMAQFVTPQLKRKNTLIYWDVTASA